MTRNVGSVSPRRQIRIRKPRQRSQPPPLDLHTPSGKLLPF
jgi:hypothetical protein